MKVAVQRPLTEAEREKFLQDHADTTPYLDPIAIVEYQTTKQPKGASKGSRAVRKRAKRGK